MNTQRLQSLQRSLNGMAKKVYEAVPISEAWTTHKIFAEVARVTGTRPDYAVVNGCLNTIRDQGLIKEPNRGCFIRVPMKEAAAVIKPTPPKEEAMAEPATEAGDATAAKDPFQLLSMTAAQMRARAKELNKLADQIEEAACLMDDKLKAVSKDEEKVKAAKAALAQLLAA